MALTLSRIDDRRGITLIELVVASLLLSLVIGGAASIYLSGARFLSTSRATSINFQAPDLSEITRRIGMGKQATVTQGNSQLNIACDCNGTTLVPRGLAPDVPGDDQWIHFRIVGTQVHWLVEGAQPDGSDPGTTVGGSDPVLFSNVNPGASSFAMVNPTGSDANTVVETIMVFTAPPTTFKTRTALGGGAKR